MKRFDPFLRLLFIVIPVHLLLLAAITETARAQTPSFQWAKRVASTVNEDGELSVGMALDSQGNCYVTGWFDGTNDFGGVALTNTLGGGQDIFVAKYNSSGVLTWVRQAGGNSNSRDGGRGIGVDDAGNVYVTGEFLGPADFDGIHLSGSTRDEFFLAKYDNAGTIQWVRESTGGDKVYGTGLAVDGEGNSYAVGYANNGVAFMLDTMNLLNTNNDGYSTFLVKYDNAGTVQWAQLIGGPGKTYTTKVAVDTSGNVYVRGSFSENVTIGNSNLVASVSEENLFLAKFDNVGILTWVKQAMGGNVDEGGVAVDQTGNVYVSGGFGGSPVDFGGGISLTNAGMLNPFIAKYSNSGVIQWARQVGTNIGFYWDAGLDQQGNVYTAGALGSNAVTLGSAGAMVAKYDPSGTLQWANSASGPSENPVFSISTKCAVDAGGNCYLAGWYRTNTSFGATLLQPQGYWNYFLAKVGVTPLTLSITWSNALPRLSVSGEISNRFALEYVSALTASNNWQGLVTNTITSNPFIHTDTNAVVSARRFYRARLVP